MRGDARMLGRFFAKIKTACARIGALLKGGPW
jgi:hypothetical protein